MYWLLRFFATTAIAVVLFGCASAPTTRGAGSSFERNDLTSPMEKLHILFDVRLQTSSAADWNVNCQIDTPECLKTINEGVRKKWDALGKEAVKALAERGVSTDYHIATYFDVAGAIKKPLVVNTPKGTTHLLLLQQKSGKTISLNGYRTIGDVKWQAKLFKINAVTDERHKTPNDTNNTAKQENSGEPTQTQAAEQRKETEKSQDFKHERLVLINSMDYSYTNECFSSLQYWFENARAECLRKHTTFLLELLNNYFATPRSEGRETEEKH